VTAAALAAIDGAADLLLEPTSIEAPVTRTGGGRRDRRAGRLWRHARALTGADIGTVTKTDDSRRTVARFGNKGGILPGYPSLAIGVRLPPLWERSNVYPSSQRRDQDQDR
jgi:hypothetical protein